MDWENMTDVEYLKSQVSEFLQRVVEKWHPRNMWPSIVMKQNYD